MNKSIAEKVNLELLNLIVFINKLLNIRVGSGQFIILNYHSICNDNWRFSTPINEFEKQIEYLIRNYKIVSLSEMLASRDMANMVCLTFDDGYKDLMTTVLPLLSKLKLQATVFVLGKYDSPSRSNLGTNKQTISPREIKILADAGWEIGFHSVSHNDLTLLSDAELENEIISGKVEIERSLGFPVKYFAYPFGNYNATIIEIVKKAGFEAAFTTDSGTFSLSANKLKIPRIPLEGKLTLNQFVANISNLGIEFTKFYIKSLQLKEKIGNFINNR